MNHSELPEPKFLSVPEAARVCGVSRNTVYMWVRQGKLGAYQTPGRTNLIRPGDLIRFMEQNGMFVPTTLSEMAREDERRMGTVARPPTDPPLRTGVNGVLIVDDDPMSRTVAMRAVPPGNNIYQAETGYEALHILTGHDDIRVVLLDLRMPGQHGLDTLREIARGTPNVSIIVVSGFAGDIPEDPAVRNLVYAVVQKPVVVGSLSELITAALALHTA